MINLKLKYSILNPVIFLLVIWLVKDLEDFTSIHFSEYGIYPRTILGLRGILFAPLLHGDYWHLISNTFPILFLGTMLYYFYEKIANQIILSIYFITNLLVWLLARPSYHIGASGLIYGFASYLFWSGIFRKDRRTLAISMIIVLMYSGLISGIFPLQIGVSWESHLFGALVGLALSFYYKDVPIWEKEDIPDPPDFREVQYKYVYQPSVFKQNTNSLLMIRPKHFGFNPQTAGSNIFQKANDLSNPSDVENAAIKEFDFYYQTLINHGISVYVFEDQVNPICPDAVFSNNWMSFHHDGTLIKYPVEAPNRRLERRDDILDLLHHKYGFVVTRKLDFSEFEQQKQYLESTGSIIFDHLHKKAYALLSSRTNEQVLNEICIKINYESITFKAKTSNEHSIYHSNVALSIGEFFAVICFEVIDEQDALRVKEHLISSNKEIIEISEKQMFEFCGNILQVENAFGKKYIIMSENAFTNFTEQQKAKLILHGELIPIPLTTIEYYGGGSARCMLTEIFLPRG